MAADSPPPVVQWPLVGGDDSLETLCSPRVAMELRRAADALGRVVLDLGERTLRTNGTGADEAMVLTLGGLTSFQLCSGTIELLPGQGLVIQPRAPLRSDGGPGDLTHAHA